MALLRVALHILVSATHRDSPTKVGGGALALASCKLLDQRRHIAQEPETLFKLAAKEAVSECGFHKTELLLQDLLHEREAPKGAICRVLYCDEHQGVQPLLFGQKFHHTLNELRVE